MAGRWCGVVSLLSFLVIYLLNTSCAHISDAESGYLHYESDLQSPEDVIALKPLIRLRRDNLDTKDGEKSDVTEKKATVPTKSPKSGKATPPEGKTKLLLSKKKPSDTPSAETPASNVTSASTTSTTTSSPTTTTTTTTSIPVTSTKEDNEKNSTGGIMALADSVPESTTTSSNLTKDETIAIYTEAPIKPTEAVDLEDDPSDEEDPDSGDNVVEPIKDFITENTTVDHHRYYKSYTFKEDGKAMDYWVNLDSLEEEKVVTNKMLSHSHRRAATVTLTFDFPFYGHLLRNITIATGGFLFTGNFVHTWLAATQYIAPLMANFDTSMSEDAFVKYADNGTSFTVQWDNVVLKDHQSAGTFTFQVTLHKTGDITFTYKQIPVTVTAIGDAEHPVKVGLSDAYIVDRTIFYVRRKTIYEYHKIDMRKSSLIGNWTTILFEALPTCVALNSCKSCLTEKISFQCQWCNKIGRCSSGLDRNRQDWLYNGCEAHSVQDFDICDTLPPPPTPPTNSNQWPSANGSAIDTFGHNASVEPYNKVPGSPVLDASEYKKGIVTDGEPDTLAHTSGRDADANSGVGGVVAVIFLVALVLGVGGWVAYAYFYPHSASGQILIRYRPSTWSWRRGEARYTAAAIHSIHM